MHIIFLYFLWMLVININYHTFNYFKLYYSPKVCVYVVVHFQRNMVKYMSILHHVLSVTLFHTHAHFFFIKCESASTIWETFKDKRYSFFEFYLYVLLLFFRTTHHIEASSLGCELLGVRMNVGLLSSP